MALEFDDMYQHEVQIIRVEMEAEKRRRGGDTVLMVLLSEII
jgi:hypothetical protein